MVAAPLHLEGYDGIEFWVGNAKQSAHFYRVAFGFSLVAYAGPETGVSDRCSYVLDQGAVRLVLTSAVSPVSDVVSHHARHGDAVRDVAFRVDDAVGAFGTALERGATPMHEPRHLHDEYGDVVVAAISVFGDTIHSFVEHRDYQGPHRPGFVAVEDPLATAVGLDAIDHVVANVERGRMDEWADFYERILAFAPIRHFDDEDVSTRDTALMSRVLRDTHGHIKIPINEPAHGRRRSQIEEFLDANGGPGIQHIALESDDIVRTVTALRERGVGFLDVPAEYYPAAASRVGDVDESWTDLAELGILVDRDDEGYLLQIFTEPLQDRPTMFYEIIQRRGSTGFGLGNFRALFTAIERAQARRGNL